MYYKITNADYKKTMNRLLKLKNPEISQIIEVVDKKLDCYKQLFGEFMPIEISDWYHTKHESDNPFSKNEQYGDDAWWFVKYLFPVVKDANRITIPRYPEPLEDTIFESYPPIGCLMFLFSLEIPNFVGSNLDIPNTERRIKFDCGSSWSMGIVYPTIEDSEVSKKYERVDFSTSLNSIETMFEITSETEAYILTKFDNILKYYTYLAKINERKTNKELSSFL